MQKLDLTNLKPLPEKAILRAFGNIAHSTLSRWVNLGCPRHEIRHGRKIMYRYYIEEINQWLEEQGNLRVQAVEERKAARRKKDKYFIKYPLIGEEEADAKEKKQ